MDKAERIKMVKAMEFIARHVNDEEVFETWLENGVADCDIEFGDLSTECDADFEFYIRDDVLSDLMITFVYVMWKAQRSGGLQCDYVRRMNGGK